MEPGRASPSNAAVRVPTTTSTAPLRAASWTAALPAAEAAVVRRPRCNPPGSTRRRWSTSRSTDLTSGASTRAWLPSRSVASTTAATASCSSLPAVLHRKDAAALAGRDARSARTDVPARRRRRRWEEAAPARDGARASRRPCGRAHAGRSGWRRSPASKAEVAPAPPRSFRATKSSRWRGARDRSGSAAARISAHSTVAGSRRRQGRARSALPPRPRAGHRARGHASGRRARDAGVRTSAGQSSRGSSSR